MIAQIAANKQTTDGKRERQRKNDDELILV